MTLTEKIKEGWDNIHWKLTSALVSTPILGEIFESYVISRTKPFDDTGDYVMTGLGMFLMGGIGVYISYIREKAIRDPLTGLYNRYFYKKNIKKIIKKAAKDKEDIGIIMIDIDDFKYLNDKFGHLKGDEILERSARIIDDSIKISDYSIRWGGDEILIILPNANRGTGKEVMERINERIRAYNDSKYNKIEKLDEKNNLIKYELSFSAGHTLRSHLSKEPVEATIKRADQGMYKKKNGNKINS